MSVFSISVSDDLWISSYKYISVSIVCSSYITYNIGKNNVSLNSIITAASHHLVAYVYMIFCIF